MQRLLRKIAIISVASFGIGRAIARKFTGEGAGVHNSDVTETVGEGGTPTVGELAAPG